MRKRVVNTSTQLDLNITENKAKLNDLENGELVIQSSKAGELKIWGKTLGGSVVSTPSNGEIAELIDGKLSEIEVDSFLKKENLNTINGKLLYNESGIPVDIVIEGGNVDEEQLKEYAKVSDVGALSEVVKNKADKDYAYSKFDTNALLDNKVSYGVVYTKDEVNAELNKKANKGESYTKAEVDNLVSIIPTFSIEVVELLPTENISETTMYLVSTGENSEDGTLYTINIYSKGEWKELGKQSVNFKNYFTKDEVLLEITNNLNDTLKNYYKQTDIDNKLSNVPKIGDVVNNSTFNAYTETVYTKNEVDALIDSIEISGGTVTDEQLSDYVKKDSLKTINGKSLLLAGVEGEETNLVIEAGTNVDELKTVFVEQGVHEKTVNSLESKIDEKVNSTIYDSKMKEIDDVLSKKAEVSYVTDYVQATLAEKESYGMVIIPETVYEDLIKNRETYWNGVLLTYNENNIYFLYDETEEPEVLPDVIPDFTKENVKLMNDYNPIETITINGVTTLNLNSKKIIAPTFIDESDYTTNSYGLWVKEGGEVIINGEGTIESQDAHYSMAVWAQGGKVIISGGTFKNAGDGCDLIYASEGGQVEIYGGEFIATEYKGTEAGTTNPHSALNVKNAHRDYSDIKVYGGRFYKFDPANNLSEPNPSAEWLESHPNGFVAEGYKSIQDGDWFIVISE